MRGQGPDGLTRRMLAKVQSHGATGPFPLGSADLTQPFVYERRFGVFYVPFGYHQSFMALLLAFQHNSTDAFAVGKKLGLSSYGSGDIADYWFRTTPGAAFRSSVGDHIQVWTLTGMTVFERTVFGSAIRLFSVPGSQDLQGGERPPVTSR